MENTAKDIDNKVRDIEHIVKNPPAVKGWGVDINPENDPTYPMKNRNNGEHAGYSWERPPLQPVDIEVLHSIERPNVSATFGTSVPPSGLSGLIRRAAFQYSENSYGHWVPLMLADRVNMVEGVLNDVARGHIPNIFGELGWKAEWKYNRKRLVGRVLVGAALATAFVALVRSKKDDSYTEE